MSSANRALDAGAATGGEGGNGLLSHSLLLGERLYFFSRLRFLAAAGILTGVLFAIHVVGIKGLNLRALAGSAVFLALCNLPVFFAVRPCRGPERVVTATRSLAWIATATTVLELPGVDLHHLAGGRQPVARRGTSRSSATPWLS